MHVHLELSKYNVESMHAAHPTPVSTFNVHNELIKNKFLSAKNNNI